MIIERILTGPVPENPTNVWLLENEDTKQAVIVDPGDDADIIKERIKDRRLEPKAILLTHGHFDHIMAVEKLRKTYGIPVYANIEEKYVLESSNNNSSAFRLGRPTVLKPDIYIRDGDLLQLAGFWILVITTPGHTAGSTCYYLKEENALFSGDTIFAGRHGRIDLDTSVPEKMMDSVLNKLMVLPPETKVYPGHGPDTTIAAERKTHGFLH